MSTLGIHSFATGQNVLPRSIPDMFNGLDIIFPDPKSKQTSNISIHDYWNGLTHNTCDWNILDRISKRSEGITLCPPIPLLMKHTVGNINVAEKRIPADPAGVYSKWLRNNRPHITENKFHTELYKILKDETGTLMQSFTTSCYIALVTEGLEVSYDDINSGLSDEWNNIAMLKGVDIIKIKSSKDCNNLINHLRSRIQLASYNIEKIINTTGANPKYIRHTSSLIFEYFKIRNQKCAFSKSYTTLCNDLTDAQIKNAFAIAFLKSYGREVDVFAILPNLKMLLQIEIKATTTATTVKSLKKYKKEIYDQLSEMKDWTFKAHGDIFDGWNYVSVAALPYISKASLHPDVFDPADEIFVISKDDLEKGLGVWWEKIQSSFPTVDNAEKEECYDNYYKFMMRSIGFSRFGHDIRTSVKEGAKRIQDALIGTGAKPILPGARPDERWPLLKTPVNLSAINLYKDVDDKERPALSAILWSKHQATFLQNDPHKLIFNTDFGTGKSLLMKTKSKEISRRTGETVYYISLSAVNYNHFGMVEFGNVYTIPAIFDLTTEAQFTGTDVTFLSAPALLEKYTIETGCSNTNALELLEWLVTKEPDANYYIDEYGLFPYKDVDGQLNRFKKLATLFKNRAWIAFRKAKEFDEEGFAKIVTLMNEMCIQHKFCVPDLEIVMRSPGALTSSLNAGDGYSFGADRRDHAGGIETVPGLQPITMDASGAFGKIKHLEMVLDNITTKFEREALVILILKGFTFRTELFRALNKYETVKYMLDERGNNPELMRKYLDQPHCILVTDIDTFSGMEARSIVVFDTGFSGEWRDCALRTVCNLVYVVVNGEYHYNGLVKAGFIAGGQFVTYKSRFYSNIANLPHHVRSLAKCTGNLLCCCFCCD